MEDLLKKLSHYQIFNFLLSGSILTVLLTKTINISLIVDDPVATFFIYYFVGLVVSRLGSLLIEPLLKRLKIIVFAPYPDYLKAVKKDPKIDTLSQENNTYRTLIATFIAYIIIFIIHANFSNNLAKHTAITFITLAALAVVLFVFAYRKQTNYITKRVKSS